MNWFFVNGFVKRAMEYGLTVKEAADLLPTSTTPYEQLKTVYGDKLDSQLTQARQFNAGNPVSHTFDYNQKDLNQPYKIEYRPVPQAPDATGGMSKLQHKAYLNPTAITQHEQWGMPKGETLRHEVGGHGLQKYNPYKAEPTLPSYVKTPENMNLGENLSEQSYLGDKTELDRRAQALQQQFFKDTGQRITDEKGLNSAFDRYGFDKPMQDTLQPGDMMDLQKLYRQPTLNEQIPNSPDIENNKKLIKDYLLKNLPGIVKNDAGNANNIA